MVVNFESYPCPSNGGEVMNKDLKEFLEGELKWYGEESGAGKLIAIIKAQDEALKLAYPNLPNGDVHEQWVKDKITTIIEGV